VDSFENRALPLCVFWLRFFPKNQKNGNDPKRGQVFKRKRLKHEKRLWYANAMREICHFLSP
jgi:hypothetical protein